MTTYTLDVSNWRCGDFGLHALGKGPTKMLNSEGFMCCLGQFSCQSLDNPAVLQGEGTPSAVARQIGELYNSHFVKPDNDYEYLSTDLARNLWKVNDDKLTSPAKKVEQIRTLLAQEGHDLVVVDEQNLLGGKS